MKYLGCSQLAVPEIALSRLDCPLAATRPNGSTRGDDGRAEGWVDGPAALVGSTSTFQVSSFTQSMREPHPIFNRSKVSFSPQEKGSGCRVLEGNTEREMC